MKRIKWVFIPDYKDSKYIEAIDLLVCYSGPGDWPATGQRYVALNVYDRTIAYIQKAAPVMIIALKKDMRNERHGRSLRRLRKNSARRRA